ncbi:MAG: hypothetical protein M3Q56_10250 [Bacteroidota bacterium]|nr:hypothetical protein [Bacteroidota bacterium]
MSDPLKKFIQKHKEAWDDKTPDDQVFHRVITAIQKSTKTEPKTKKIVKPFLFKWSIAASIAVLISVIWLILLTDKPEIPQEVTVQAASIQNEKRNHSIDEINTANSGIKEIQSDEKISNSKPVEIAQITIGSTKTISGSKPKNNIQKRTVAEGPQESEKVSENLANDEEPAIVYQENAWSSQGDHEVYSKTSNEPELIQVQPMAEVSPQTNAVQVKPPTSVSQNEISQSEDSPNAPQTIGKSIKRGFINFLSKKVSQWTNNALQVNSMGTEDKSTLAIHYKNEDFEFQKLIHISKD